MKFERQMSDEAVLRELGERLAKRRLDLKLTQAEVADQAGVSKRTVERIEAGATTQVSTMIRILRALELLEGLGRLVGEVGPRPMDLLKLKGTTRRRATSRRKAPEEQKWRWGDEP